ncbi:BMC domain-containing protein [Clostridium formicaceticum]|uniref:Major carboxysome shell protein 1A n=1 Tax=Clostridium formicaceticum TaxID=1497 RepID=A0AAC9RKL0_9CLOT|nr:BMC domain-containing protein [Clostridium formicaceticum]AOY74592.1 propanediol utilization protein [Clostridium formicaceticum]ARE88956.1 Major carboxysome shell protein 1A [Clostridium formicaceticum]
MQALGLIETKGLIAATESADAMLKAADVNLLEKTYVGGGLVSIAITGDVGAVKAAVEAGGAAVKKIDEGLLISQHIIPRPHEELNSIIATTKTEPEEEPPIDEIVTIKTEPEVVIIENAVEELKEDSKMNIAQEEINQEKTSALTQSNFSELHHKEAVDKMVLESGIEETIEALGKFKVIKLRNLAREYKDFGIVGRKISRADKNLLMAEFRKYYENH